MSNSAAANIMINKRSAAQINSTKTSHSELLATTQSSWVDHNLTDSLHPST